jgi:hypothetical protein
MRNETAEMTKETDSIDTTWKTPQTKSSPDKRNLEDENN